MSKRKLIYTAFLLLFAAAATLVIYLTGNRVRLPYSDEMEAASALHVKVVQAVKEERLARGYALVPEDTLGIGLLGEEVTDITTSLGSLEAKRTSQLPDMAAAAAVLKGRHLAPGVRGIVIPATMQVYRSCMREGYTDIFLDAGCIVSPPTCGPCLGGHMGCMAAGERCVSTTNRNFVGRMGHTESEVYLASPAVAAASGIAGHIAHPEEV